MVAGGCVVQKGGEHMEIWIAIIMLVVIVILFFANKNKKEQIESLNIRHRNEKEKTDNEIKSLKAAVANGEDLLKTTSRKSSKEIEELRSEIANQAKIAQNRYDGLYQKYAQLMRTYLIARKKSQVECLDEIEEALKFDYEELGSIGITPTQYIASAMADFYTLQIRGVENELKWMGQQHRSTKIADVRKDAAMLIERSKTCQYTVEYALSNVMASNPHITSEYIEKHYGITLNTAANSGRYDSEEIENYLSQISTLSTKCRELEGKVRSFEAFKDIRWPLLRDSVSEYKKEFESNLTAIPYMSRIIADIMTIDFDRLAWSLSWGNNQERKCKVASLNALKKEKSEEIERIKGAEYQLAYLLEMYPVLQDVIDAEFKDLELSFDQVTDYDPVRRYIKREEWEKLSESERNQRALDRYVESRKKSKWQIGRDYELYCGYCYEKKGFTVDYFGSYNGLEDLGRDLIISQCDDVRIVQCKYWSKSKQIHENHVMQLYGSVIEYNLENNQHATGILITNTELSAKAKEFAQVLGIKYKENVALGDFPRIKCNIGVGEFGEKTKIYHLPFDQQYDSTKVDGKDEFMAVTVEEAEKAGFRRAYKWHGME